MPSPAQDPSQRIVYAGYRDGACVAIHDHSHNRTARDRRETASSIADWIRRGLDVKQVSAAEAGDSMKAALERRIAARAEKPEEGK